MFVNGTISAKSVKAQQLFALANSNIAVLSANASNNGSFVKMKIPSPEGWSELRLEDETQNRKWSLGSLGDQRPDNNGGKNTFYIFQYKDQNDQAVNEYRLAITDTGNVGIGTSKATEKLHIKDGSILIDDGTQADGYVLTSDETGKGTWKSLEELSTNGDNLGDHIATQDLDMATKNILNVEKVSANTLEGNSLNSSIFAYKILNNTVNGTLELQSEAGFVGDINLNGNLHFSKSGFSVGLSNRNVSWRPSGTLIQDTGWIDFIADSNNDNDNIGFRFWSNYPLYITKYDVNNDGVINAQDPQTIINCLAQGVCNDLTYDVNESGSVTSLDSLVIINYLGRRNNSQIAAILENGVEINKPLKVEGGHLTLKDGTQAEGKILSSVTNNGLASWVDPNEIYPGQWKLVHVENFDNATTLTNWHIGSQNADLLTDCGGESILGGYNKAGKNRFLEKSFNLAGIPHNEVKITYELYSIDSWDENEGAWLEINGKRFSNSYSWHYVRNRKQVCGREGASILWNDGISFEEIQTSSTNGQLDLKFGAYLNEALNNESFGIDNLRIYVRTVDESVSLPEVAYTPPPARYYQANAKNCTNWCTSQGMTNLADPQGFYCASGEAKSVTAINQKDEGKFIFTYGCWSDGNCTEGQNSGSGASENGYCYKLGQKKDYDATDITVACYCQ
jgi:hypothetical protein